jgi:hypothetical protein
VSERTLEVGMLLLGGKQGKEGEPLDTVWSVNSVGQRSATLIAHFGSFNAKARLMSNTLPSGWRIVGNKTLARLLADLPRDYNYDRDRQAA